MIETQNEVQSETVVVSSVTFPDADLVICAGPVCGRVRDPEALAAPAEAAA